MQVEAPIEASSKLSCTYQLSLFRDRLIEAFHADSSDCSVGLSSKADDLLCVKFDVCVDADLCGMPPTANLERGVAPLEIQEWADSWGRALAEAKQDSYGMSTHDRV